MAAALPIKNGGTINPMGMPAYKLVCSMSLLHHGDRFGEKRVITRDRHQEQLNRYRFRHRPLAYLAFLETRWDQATWTGVLPP